MRLYLKYFGINFRSAMEYKASFIMTMIGTFMTAFTCFIGIWFLFQRFHHIQGYTFEQVLLCFSIIMFAFSLSEVIARGFDSFSGIISNGQFDRIMVRPRGLVFQVLAAKMEFTRVSKLLQTLIMLMYAIPRCGVLWTPDKVFVLFFMLVGATVMFCGLFVMHAAICFFTTEGIEVFNILTDGSKNFGQYPVSIYGKGMVRFYTYVVPMACVQYYPLLYLLDRGPVWYGLLPAAGFLFLIPSYILWRIGVRHYKSTGS